MSLAIKPPAFDTELTFIKWYPHILITLSIDIVLSYGFYRLVKYVRDMDRIDEIEI